ncbi:hypothetical protein AQUCO_01300526v1, partial [Aquilegia coerulea]
EKNDIDALPSKLRKLLEFTSTSSSTKGKALTDVEAQKKSNKKRDDVKTEKKSNLIDEPVPKTYISKEKSNDEKVDRAKYKDGNDEADLEDTNDKKKGKWKRNQVKDLRFDATGEMGSYGSKKRERKKKYLEAKKMKHKKAKVEEGTEFPEREHIAFGDVVDAPPKLIALPKAFKKVQDASHERLRLQAVEAYRNRKGWISRPGISLPSIIPNVSV